MIDEKLLIEVLGWQSESRKESEQIIPTLNNYLDKINLNGEFIIEEDTHGNIYITKGKADLYPCIVSHLDQVHKFADNKKIIKNDDYLIALNGAKQIGTGGDDLVGVFICLELLQSIDIIKIAFFVQEEIGCIGSNACDLDFFEDCMFIGQADRKGNSDFINFSNGVKLFDEEFSTFIAPILLKYNYKEEYGIATDAGALSKRGVNIACFNISSGYYNAHTNTEYVCISEVDTCYNVICNIIENADKKFTYIRPKVGYTKSNTSSKSKLYNLLYSDFKKSANYVASNKMFYAYSLAIQHMEDLIKEYDLFLDSVETDFPYISDQLEEFLEFKEEGEETVSKETTTSVKQLKMFTCEHRNVKFDNYMNQSYCMDCFEYVDNKDTFYDTETLNSYNKSAGFY